MPNRLLSAAKRTTNLILGSLGLELRRTQRFAARTMNQAVAADRLIPQTNNAVRWPYRPAAFVLVSSNHGTMIINRNDYCLSEQNEAFFGIGYSMLNTSSIDALEVQNLLSLLSNRRRFYGEGVVAVDCGANIGVHTIEYSRHMFGWGTVIAIEAQEMLFYALCGNVVINNCLNARALFAAVGSDVREILVPSLDYFKPASFASLELHQSSSNEFIGQNVEYGTKCKKVQQITIDHLKLERVDLLKIDVEGMEADVLAGAENTIRSHKPQLYVEWIKSDANSIVETLNRWGYKHYIVGDNMIAVHESDGSGANISVQDGSLHICGN
jgi:FkbM family methyltransferase